MSQSDINFWRSNYQFCILFFSVLERPQFVGRLGDHVQASAVLAAAVVVPAPPADPVAPRDFGGRGRSRRRRRRPPGAVAVAVPAPLEGDVAGDVPVSLDLAFVLSLRYDPERNATFNT